MPKKRKINPARLEEIGELQLASLTAKEVAVAARHTDREAEDAFNRKLNGLRLKVATGSYTTGDRLLDINIVVNCSVAMDERYVAMVELEKTLALHETELTADAQSSAFSTPRIENMGVLPACPRLQFSVGGAFGRGLMLGGDASTKIVLPVVDRNGSALKLLVPRWEETGDKLSLGANIVFEDKLQWFLDNEPNMHLAVALWSNSRALGRPLVAPDRVTREIMVRREDCALKLQGLVIKLNHAIITLKKTQEDPKSWTRTQTTIEGAQVIVSFASEVHNVKSVRKDLAREITDAVRLGMDEEPVSRTYKGAVTALDSSAEWDD